MFSIRFLSTNNKKLWSSKALIAFLIIVLVKNYRKYKTTKNSAFKSKFCYVLLKRVKILKYVLFWNGESIGKILFDINWIVTKNMVTITKFMANN